VPVSGWQERIVFIDYTAASPRLVPAGGCGGFLMEYTYYTYFVQARNPGGEGPLIAGARGCLGNPPE